MTENTQTPPTEALEPIRLLAYTPTKQRAPINWDIVRQANLGSDKTHAEIAEVFKIHIQSIKNKSASENWPEQRRQLTIEHENRALNRGRFSNARIDAIKSFCESDLKVAKAIRGKVARALSKDEDLDPKDLRALASAHESAQRVGRIALGLPSTIGQNSTTIEGGDPSKPITVDINTFADLEITELLVLKNTLQKIGVGLDDS